MYIKWQQENDNLGSISPTCLCTAFTPVAPKSVRFQSSCKYLFTLLGSTVANTARRMLMKLTPGWQKAQWVAQPTLLIFVPTKVWENHNKSNLSTFVSTI